MKRGLIKQRSRLLRVAVAALVLSPTWPARAAPSTGAAASQKDAPALFRAAAELGSRVQRVDYRDDLVMSVVGFTDHPFVLELPGDEEVRDVAGGGLVSGTDLKAGVLGGWETHRRGSRLFVRPLSAAKRTTLLVTSSKGRAYVLDLVPGGSSRKDIDRRTSRIVVTEVPVLARPMFQGPSSQVPQSQMPQSQMPQSLVLPPHGAVHQDPTAPSRSVDAASAASASVDAPSPMRAAGIATPPRPVEPSTPARNVNYSLEEVKLTADIRPSEVFDDGRFTYLRFPPNAPIPAIYKSVPKTEQEWLVNSHREGDWVVMHGVARLWNLRLDDSLVGVFNEAFDPRGGLPTQVTALPAPERGASR